MPITKLRPSFTFDEDRLAQLRAVVPEAFADGQINWDTLHEALGDHLEEQSPDAEHFGLFWPGKRQARRLAARRPDGALIRCPGQGVEEATTRNIFIEGENLEVLKLLLKSYAGQVKLIYIDPPYNTGKDLVYRDDFVEPLESYLRMTGQADEEGTPLTTNTAASGRFHSNWLTMMYPRLKLARNLLRDDGVLFVSIDDGELSNLRAICSEIFGEENHLAVLVHQRAKGGGQAKQVVKGHDYILAYARNLQACPPLRRDKVVQGRTEIIDGVEYLVDDDVVRKRFGKYDKTQGDRRCFYEELEQYKGPAKKAEIDALLAKGELFLLPWEGGVHAICRRVPLETATSKLYSIIKVLSEEGKKDLQELGLEDAFSYPKPKQLLTQLVRAASSGAASEIVLDFFAGSGTTAHGVLERNATDSSNRRYILVELPEPLDPSNQEQKAGADFCDQLGVPRNIAELCKERLRRAGEKIHADNPLFAGDLGFRCYRLDRSNFRRWRDYEGESPGNLQTLFDQFETPLVDGWSPDNLLVEIMLLEGFPLDSAVTPQPTFPHNSVHLVESEWCDHRLFLCLDPAIHDDTLANLSPVGKDVFVCLDSSLTDEAKLRLADACELKVI